MRKTVLVTGATDGIGLGTARALVGLGHHVLVHGRNAHKLETLEALLAAMPGNGRVEGYLADLSLMSEVEALAGSIAERHTRLDVLINNAGVYQTPAPVTPAGLDARFAVNTIAPYLLTQRLLPLMNATGRVINVSSAAQEPVSLDALAGRTRLADDYAAYAQSKLALTMWSCRLAQSLGDHGPAIIAVNPGSLLGTRMVREAFGVTGKDVGIGVEIVTRAALGDEFAVASGQYFDNDSGRFATPHPDARNARKCAALVETMETVLAGCSAGRQ